MCLGARGPESRESCSKGMWVRIHVSQKIWSLYEVGQKIGMFGQEIMRGLGTGRKYVQTGNLVNKL